MKNFIRISAAGAFLAAGAAFAIGIIQGYALKWTPKEGDSITYQMTGNMEVGGGEATLKQKSVEKVLKVDSDGSYSIQSSSQEGTVSISGQEIPIPGNVVVTHYKPTGEVIDITGDNVPTGALRLNNLTSLRRPEKSVNVGDTWTFEVKADEKKGTVAVKGTMKLESEEKVDTTDTIKVSESAKETEGTDGGSVESTYWVSKADFSLVKYSSKWTNVTVPGAPGPVSGTMTMARVAG